MSPKTNVLISLCAAAGLVGASVAAPVAEGGRKFTTTLSGSAVVPGPGDPDGSGTATITLNYGQSRVCFDITLSDIATPEGIHIHEAVAGVSGPVVIPLVTSPTAPLSGCRTADREEIKDIIQRPEEYYVQAHNAEFEGGAIRGQLSK